MKTSNEINEIATALSTAQGHMTGAKKESVNPFFKANYSSLADIMQAISKPFFDNGLSFVQAAETEGGMIAVTTRIMHKSGQWIESLTMLPPVKTDPQAYGSAITYAKRYGLQALAGVPSIDDDAQFASASVQNKAQEKQKVNDKHFHDIKDRMTLLLGAVKIEFIDYYNGLTDNERDACWPLLDKKMQEVALKMFKSIEDK